MPPRASARPSARRTALRLAVLAAAVAPLLLSVRPARAERDVDGLEELIPRAESALERERLLANGLSPIDGRAILADPPPAPPVRNCAEWEPLTGVLIRYPLGLPYQLLRDFDDDLTLHVVVSSTYYNTARTNLAANGVDTTKVQWLVKPNDSIWTRDYGPWFVFDGGGDITVVDHVYNRPSRPNDDLIPVELANQLGLPVVRHDMWHTGGNYMTDGEHVSMSTDLVYDEALGANGMTPAAVDALMQDYYGVTTYHVLDDISPSGIHHIDTWAKLLDEETILIKEVATNHATWAALEQRATLIGSLLASTGRPYRVFRVYCPNIAGGQPASYTNSLIANDRIYVPMFSRAADDSAAAAVYRAAAPGYDVRGYAYGGWITDDALHCRAKGVMDAGMLRVAHVPVEGPVFEPVVIQALVDDRSEAGIDSVVLYWRANGGTWASPPMHAVGGDLYEGTIPAPPLDATIDYFILASDLSGRTEGHPRPAPAGWHSFEFEANPVGVEAVGAADSAPRAFPNPFTDATRFAFELRFAGSVELAVHDVAGRRVRTLASGERAPGRHEIVWDGRDDSGRRVPAGVYYFRLQAAGLVHARPVVLTR